MPVEEPVEISDVQARLQRLWKGTLIVAVAGGYVSIVALLLFHHGWQPALLALFLIVLSQFFRYIANDVDRIGWDLSEQRQGDGVGDQTASYQGRLLRLLIGLAQLQNLVLIGQAYLLADIGRAAATAVGLVLIECLYWQIRKVNRQVEFEQASYGFRDRGMLSDGPESIRPSDKAKQDKLNRKLDTLSKMAEAGEISQYAYEKARDKHRVRSVMADDGRR